MNSELSKVDQAEMRFSLSFALCFHLFLALQNAIHASEEVAHKLQEDIGSLADVTKIPDPKADMDELETKSEEERYALEESTRRVSDQFILNAYIKERHKHIIFIIFYNI